MEASFIMYTSLYSAKRALIEKGLQNMYPTMSTSNRAQLAHLLVHTSNTGGALPIGPSDQFSKINWAVNGLKTLTSTDSTFGTNLYNYESLSNHKTTSLFDPIDDSIVYCKLTSTSFTNDLIAICDDNLLSNNIYFSTLAPLVLAANTKAGVSFFILQRLSSQLSVFAKLASSPTDTSLPVLLATHTVAPNTEIIYGFRTTPTSLDYRLLITESLESLPWQINPFTFASLLGPGLRLASYSLRRTGITVQSRTFELLDSSSILI